MFDHKNTYMSGSVVFSLGIGIERVLHDCLHSQLLGTGKSLNGSAIIYLAEAGFWKPFPSGTYEVALTEVLREAHKHLLQWKKHHHLQMSQPRFTAARLSRKHRKMYPSLACKGVASKVISFWIAECTMVHASTPGASHLDKLVSACTHSYASALKVMSTANVIMTPAEAEQYYQNCMLHLQTFAMLHKMGRSAVRKEPNRALWQLLTKHHHYYHHAKTTRRERINPSMSQLLSAEDWVGKIGRIARSTHKKNLSLRTLERYLALLYISLNRI